MFSYPIRKLPDECTPRSGNNHVLAVMKIHFVKVRVFFFNNFGVRALVHHLQVVARIFCFIIISASFCVAAFRSAAWVCKIAHPHGNQAHQQPVEADGQHLDVIFCVIRSRSTPNVQLCPELQQWGLTIYVLASVQRRCIESHKLKHWDYNWSFFFYLKKTEWIIYMIET